MTRYRHLRSLPRVLALPRSIALAPWLSLTLIAGALAVVLPAMTAPAHGAARVPTSVCRAHDPTVVHGACLRYRASDGVHLAWLGTRRDPNGRIFFCIDFMYSSRLPRSAPEVSTRGLINQFGDRIGKPEIAALNQLISRWSGRGSTGDDDRDAAIGLIIREVMGDGHVRSGAQVFPSGLRVGQRVRPPLGDLAPRVLKLANRMWWEASRLRGPYRVELRARGKGRLRLGESRTYVVRVRSAAGAPVYGVRVRLACSGPITCPLRRITKRGGAPFRVHPTGTGRYRIRARAKGPAAHARLYSARGWRPHRDRVARSAGRQRGWIAQRSTAVTSMSARARIVRARPRITTVASHQRALPGTALHDVVRLQGLAPGHGVAVRAELYGPFVTRPGPGDCTPDRLAGRVGFAAAVDGEYLTPTITVEHAGYYTWVERIEEDRWTRAAITRCGLVEETTLVEKRVPTISTVVSAQRALTGDRIHDRVRVRGIRIGETVRVKWRLLGPVAPDRHGRCHRARWRGARVAAKGSFTATGPGTYRTRWFRVRRPGCYTYTERAVPTATTAGVSTPPGLRSETSLVTRPVTPLVPEVPTGGPVRRGVARLVGPLHVVSHRDDEQVRLAVMPPRRAVPRYLDRPYRGRSAATSNRSGRLTLGRLGVDLGLVGVGLDGGTVAVPRNRRLLGWLNTTARPADVIGASVLAGHRSDRRHSPHGLWRLRGVRVGDVIVWRTRSGERHRFVVTAVRRHPRTRGIPARLLRTDGARVLHLITCTRGRGGRFADNLVVTAREE